MVVYQRVHACMYTINTWTTLGDEHDIHVAGLLFFQPKKVVSSGNFLQTTGKSPCVKPSSIELYKMGHGFHSHVNLCFKIIPLPVICATSFLLHLGKKLTGWLYVIHGVAQRAGLFGYFLGIHWLYQVISKKQFLDPNYE